MNLEATYQTLSIIDGVKYAWNMSKKYILPQTLQSLTKSNIKNSSKHDSDDVVLGYEQTLKMIFQDYETLIFEESLVRKLHEKILHHSNIDLYKKGQYNFNSTASSQNIMGIFMGKQAIPPAQEEIKNAIEKYKEPSCTSHPILKIADFIQTFLTLRPFREGNTQVAHVLITLLMLQQGYEFVKWSTLPSQKETSFNLESFLNDVKNQALSSIQAINEDTIEHLLSPKQSLLWEWACQDKSREFSRKDAVDALHFPERTVEEIIKKFTLMKRLIRIGQGKATRYKVV